MFTYLLLLAILRSVAGDAECIRTNTHIRVLLETIHQTKSDFVAVNIGNFQRNLDSMSVILPDRLAKLKNVLSTQFKESQRPEKHEQLTQQFSPLIRERTIEVMLVKWEEAREKCFRSSEGEILTVNSAEEFASLPELFTILNIDAIIVPATITHRIFISPLGFRIGGVSKRMHGWNGQALSGEAFVTNWTSVPYIHLKMVEGVIGAFPLPENIEKFNILCRKTKNLATMSRHVFDSAKSLLGSLVQQMPKIRLAQVEYRKFIAHLKAATPASVYRAPISKVFSSMIPLFTKMLTAMTLPGQLARINNYDLTKYTQMLAMIPKIVSRISSFTTGVKWQDVQGVAGLLKPTSLTESVMRGDFSTLTDKTVEVYRMFPMLLPGDQYIRDAYIVHYAGTDLWYSSPVLPIVSNCHYNHKRKICDVYRPRQANTRCGTELTAVTSRYDEGTYASCALTHLKENLYLATPCTNSKLMALIGREEAKITMHCALRTFEYDLLHGTSLFSTACNIRDRQSKASLFRQRHTIDVYTRPMYEHFAVAGETEVTSETVIASEPVLILGKEKPAAPIVKIVTGGGSKALSNSLLTVAIVSGVTGLLAVVMCIIAVTMSCRYNTLWRKNRVLKQGVATGVETIAMRRKARRAQREVLRRPSSFEVSPDFVAAVSHARRAQSYNKIPEIDAYAAANYGVAGGGTIFDAIARSKTTTD